MKLIFSPREIRSMDSNEFFSVCMPDCDKGAIYTVGENGLPSRFITTVGGDVASLCAGVYYAVEIHL